MLLSNVMYYAMCRCSVDIIMIAIRANSTKDIILVFLL